MKQTLTLSLLLLLTLSACTHKKDETSLASPSPSDTAPLKALDGISKTDLGFPLFKLETKNPANSLISPIAIKEAFSVLDSALSLNQKEFLNQFFDFQDQTPHPAFTSDHSLWTKNAKNLPKTLRSQSNKLEAAPFNQWLSDACKQIDLNGFEFLTPSASVVAVSTVYFHLETNLSFEPKNLNLVEFKSSPYSTQRVKAIKIIDHFQYTEDKNARWLELPLLNADLRLLLALPLKNKKLSQAEENLSSASLKEIEKQLKYDKIELTLPNFSFSKINSIKKMFSEAGYADFFNPTPKSKTTPSLFDSIDILQASRMDLIGDSKEVKKNNISAGIADDFALTEPFLFILKNKTTGEIYALGRVNQIEEAIPKPDPKK